MGEREPPDVSAATPMRRIVVVGCSGAGKSRLSKELGRRLGIPVVHLDAAFWQPGWVESPDGAWEAKVATLLEGEAWVCDGNYVRTLPQRAARADTVVHLDLPRRTCLRGIATRLRTTYGRVREDMAPGCPERFDLEFLRWVWNFRRDVRPRVVDVLAAYEASGGRVVTLTSRRSTDAFLTQVGPR